MTATCAPPFGASTHRAGVAVGPVVQPTGGPVRGSSVVDGSVSLDVTRLTVSPQHSYGPTGSIVQDYQGSQ